jgi:hypothetical protein
MGQAAGGLSEVITLTLPGPSIPDRTGGQKPGVGIATPPRPARVRLLRASEKVRYGLSIGTQAWEITTRALHPLEFDPYYQAHKGRISWKDQEGTVQSCEPSERRDSFILLVANQIDV